MSKIIRTIIPVILISIFLFLRFYKIDTSLFFTNDMGRDLLVLWDFIHNHQLILLGPQTSALPISQSPLYFYLLLPFYLISGQYFLSANLALAFIYISLFIFKPRVSSYLFLVTFYLISIHPQYILQGRFVWNPSLVTPFLITAILHKKQLLISTISLAIAISLSYSVAPLVIAILIFSLFINKKYLAYFLGFTTFLNLPVIIQLIRHHPNLVNQTGNIYLQKINDFNKYVFATDNSTVNSILFFGLILLLFFTFQSKNKITNYLSKIFILTFIITILSPFNLQAHYIFALTTVLFLLIGSLDFKISLPIVAFLSFFYLQSKVLQKYFAPAPRTYAQMDQCFKTYCQNTTSPTFVSVNSDLYPYHFGPEHRYLMSKNGCPVKNIEQGSGQANFMTVVLDSGSYSDQTKYYELDLFGPHQEISRLNCQDNFQIVTLSRKSKTVFQN